MIQNPIINAYALPGVQMDKVLVEYNKRTGFELVNLICDYFSIEVQDLKKRCRKKELVLARHFIFFFAKQKTKLSLKGIAILVSGSKHIMDHTTVIHGIQRIKNDLESNSHNETKKHYKNLINIIE